jgi:hypothetical protein
MLHRPYIRHEVRQEVENRAQKNSKGQFLDANTHKPIEGKYDFGHKPGHEFWREVEKAEKEGLTQEQFNNRMNNPDFYQIESPHENRSHSHEMPKAQTNNNAQINNNVNKGEKPTMDRNAFLESVKVDKATIDKTNQVSKNAAKNMSNQTFKKEGQDNGGRERGDTGPMSHGREGGNKGGPASTSQSSSGKGQSSNGQNSSSGHSSGGQTASSGHSSGGSNSGGGHGTGGSGTGGHGSGGQGGSGGHGSSGGSGGHGGH